MIYEMGQLEQLRAYQNNEGARHALAERRGAEMFAKHPQMAVPPPYLNTVAAAVEPVKHREGGDAGLRRVVGAGKRHKAKAPEKEESESDEEMEGGGIISGLNIPIISGLAGLFGLGKGEADPKKALLYGKKAAEHLKKMHGAGFLDDFAKGFMSVIKPVASVVGAIAPMIPHPAARAIGTAANVVNGLTGGGRLVPNAIPSEHLSVPPQAPEWFARNMVGQGRRKGGRTMMSPEQIMAYQAAREKKMAAEAPPNLSHPAPVLMPLKALGRGRRRGAGGAGAGHAGAGHAGAGHAGAGSTGAGSTGAGKRAARNALVKKVMTEKGMSMPEASRYIKENGLA